MRTSNDWYLQKTREWQAMTDEERDLRKTALAKLDMVGMWFRQEGYKTHRNYKAMLSQWLEFGINGTPELTPDEREVIKQWRQEGEEMQ